MVAPIEFATNTELAAGLRTLIEELEKRAGLREPIKMFIAGGMAIHLYTAARVTTDVDAEFSKRILLPAEMTRSRGVPRKRLPGMSGTRTTCA